MTLNLMLTSSQAVFLSGDFRLISPDDLSPLPDSYDTQKLIPVIRQRWSALVAYMGVASAPPLLSDMGDWILRQMEAIPFDGDFSQLAQRLLLANSWIGRIRGDRRVAISVVGFCEKEPFMMLLSNFLNLDGKTTEAGPELRAYRRRPLRAEVRVVGSSRLDLAEQARLRRLLQGNAARQPIRERIRQAIAEINAEVSRRSRGSISEACVSGYLLRSGSAEIGAHGIPEDVHYLPAWVRRDLESTNPGEFTAKPLRVRWKSMSLRVRGSEVIKKHSMTS